MPDQSDYVQTETPHVLECVPSGHFVCSHVEDPEMCWALREQIWWSAHNRISTAFLWRLRDLPSHHDMFATQLGKMEEHLLYHSVPISLLTLHCHNVLIILPACFIYKCRDRGGVRDWKYSPNSNCLLREPFCTFSWQITSTQPTLSFSVIYKDIS